MGWKLAIIKIEGRIDTGMKNDLSFEYDNMVYEREMWDWLQETDWNVFLHLCFCNPRMTEDIAKSQLERFVPRIHKIASSAANEPFEAPVVLFIERGSDDDLVHAHGLACIYSNKARRNLVRRGEKAFVKMVNRSMQVGSIPVRDWDRGTIMPVALIQEIPEEKRSGAFYYATKNCRRDHKMGNNMVLGGKMNRSVV